MNGLLIVNKPAGVTSHDVVARVRRITGERSIGHLGTLDPMATGVLPLLLGKYTRLAQFFGRLEKGYCGTIRLGYATTTYDAEGERVGEVRPTELELSAVRRVAAEELTGVIEQMPPAFSAKKINGRPAHELARQGKQVELRAVPVTVHAFEIARLESDRAEFVARVSAGGYIRSLAHDLGERLGCGAHLLTLERVSAGCFTLKDALSLEELERRAAAGTLEACFPHPRTLLPELPCATADEQTAGRLRNGGSANLPEYSNASLVKIFVGRHELLGIGKRVAGTLFQPVVVLG